MNKAIYGCWCVAAPSNHVTSPKTKNQEADACVHLWMLLRALSVQKRMHILSLFKETCAEAFDPSDLDREECLQLPRWQLPGDGKRQRF
jgi:hypothetical protein